MARLPTFDARKRDEARRKAAAAIREERQRLTSGVVDRLATKSTALGRWHDEDVDLMPYAGRQSIDD